MSSHSCDALQGCRERSISLSSIIAGQNTQIVTHAADEFDQAPHCTLIHVHMHVAKVEYSEAVKKRWQLLEHNVVTLDENAFCIPVRAPIKTRQLKGVSNDGMDRIPIPYVKEEEALAEDLRLVVRLDGQSLSRVERSETFLQFAKDIFVHGITSPKSARPSIGASGPARQIPFGRLPQEHEVQEDFPAFTPTPIGSATIFVRGSWRCGDALLYCRKRRLSWADHFGDSIALT